MSRTCLQIKKAFEIFSILNSLMDECRLTISSEGWKVRMVDPADVALVAMELPPEVFSTYEHTDQPIEVGIDLDVIISTLESANTENPEDEVELIFQAADTFEGEQGYKLILKHGLFTETFTLLLASGLRRTPKDIIIDTPCVLELYTKDLQSIVKKANRFNDYLRFSARRIDDKYEFLAIADELDTHTLNAKLKYIRYWPALLTEKNYPSISTLFSLDYLSDMVKAIVDEKVILCFGQDCPCSLQFSVCGTGKGEFLLSPRVEA